MIFTGRIFACWVILHAFLLFVDFLFYLTGITGVYISFLISAQKQIVGTR